MPLFFYLPLIVWTGMIEIMLESHDQDDNAGQTIDPADMTTKGTVIRFPVPPLAA
jgi:hypothetical protein